MQGYYKDKSEDKYKEMYLNIIRIWIIIIIQQGLLLVDLLVPTSD